MMGWFGSQSNGYTTSPKMCRVVADDPLPTRRSCVRAECACSIACLTAAACRSTGDRRRSTAGRSRRVPHQMRPSAHRRRPADGCGVSRLPRRAPAIQHFKDAGRPLVEHVLSSRMIAM